MNRRKYASALRDEQAAGTRRRIAAVAAERFADQGYAATSVAEVARGAGVTAQTVYNAFSSKAALLKAAYDMALVGDDEPVPLAQRPDVVAMYALTDPRAFLNGYAKLGQLIVGRVGPLLRQVAAGAATGEAELVAMRDTTDRERLAGCAMVARRLAELGGVRPELSADDVRDRIWLLNSWDVWDLAGRLGWPPDATAAWIGEALASALLVEDDPATDG